MTTEVVNLDISYKNPKLLALILGSITILISGILTKIQVLIDIGSVAVLVSAFAIGVGVLLWMFHKYAYEETGSQHD